MLFTKSLMREENAQTAVFRKVSEICAAVNTVVNEKDLLEVSLRQAMELFGAGRGSIFLLDKNGKDLNLAIALGMPVEEQARIVRRMGEGIIGHVAKRKLPIFVDDIENDARFHDFKARKSYRTPSFACAPLMLKDKLLGVINIADKGSGLRFDKEEMQLLDFLSSQIALNYRRLQLYKRFKSIVKETRNLKDRLGQSHEEMQNLKKQILIHERLATIGKLAGGIAHEFNNPIDGIMRYTNLCLEHIKDDEVLRGYLLEIKHGLDRMANIVKNLLASSRNEFPTGENINFAQTLERSLAGMRADIERQNITVEKEIQANIPPIYDFGLERVLTNLLRNAVDAIETGGSAKPKKGTIEIGAKYQDECLHVKIHDTGVGIPLEKTQKIFEPFYTTKSMDKGCGLGLTIVSEIIKSYNGKIHVESGPGQGTTFFINLPLGMGFKSVSPL
jgi:signal transduction histidine kinase